MSYWLHVEDPMEPDGGWRQITEAEATYRTVIEMLDAGELDFESDDERLAVVEHFRRRAHVEANLSQIGKAVGFSKQRADQVIRATIRKVQRYALGELKGSTARVSTRISAASALRDFAGATG